MGEGIELCLGGSWTFRNTETGKTRTFVSEQKRLLVEDSDIDFEAIEKEYGQGAGRDKSVKYGLSRWSIFKDGVFVLCWTILPDGMYFADSDGYGMLDNDEEKAYCIIDRDLEIVEPFRPVKDVDSYIERYKWKRKRIENGEAEIDDEVEKDIIVEDESTLDVEIIDIPNDIQKHNDDIDEKRKSMENLMLLAYSDKEVSLQQFQNGVYALRLVDDLIMINRLKNLVKYIGYGEIVGDPERDLLSKDLTIGQYVLDWSSLRCFHVMKEGLIILKGICDYNGEYMTIYEDDEGNSLYNPIKVAPCAEQVEAFCFLNEDFDYVVPFMRMDDPIKDAEKYLSGEWDGKEDVESLFNYRWPFSDSEDGDVPKDFDEIDDISMEDMLICDDSKNNYIDKFDYVQLPGMLIEASMIDVREIYVGDVLEYSARTHGSVGNDYRCEYDETAFDMEVFTKYYNPVQMDMGCCGADEAIVTCLLTAKKKGDFKVRFIHKIYGAESDVMEYRFSVKEHLPTIAQLRAKGYYWQLHPRKKE